MKETMLRTVVELLDVAESANQWGQYKLEKLLRRAALQLDEARVEAMPKDEPVIILGYHEEGPKQ